MSTNNDEEKMVHADNNDNQQLPPKSRPSMTTDEINALNYRALQKKCKSVGLSAGGSTVVLRERLSDHFEVNTDNNVDSVEDGDGINVSLYIVYVFSRFSVFWYCVFTMCDWFVLTLPYYENV